MIKKSMLLIALLTITGCLLFAQNPVTDSLKLQLKLHTQNDTTKVNLLIELAKERRRSNPAMTDSLADVALNLASQLNYTKGKGNALVVKAKRYADVLNHTAAKKTFEEASHLLQSAGDKSGQAYMFMNWGGLSMDEGDYAKSLDQYLQGLKLAQEANNVKSIVSIENNIGYLYNILGEYEKAIPYQTDGLKQSERIGYIGGMTGAYNAIGKTYKTSGNYPLSLDAYTKGLVLDERQKDSANISIDHGNIGDVHERMGNYAEAKINVQKFIDYFSVNGGPKDLAWGYWVLGKAYTHSGDPAKGFFYGKKSYELANSVGWRLYLREITYLISESAARLQQWDSAYKYQALASAYKDTLTGQDIARKTTMLQAGFELDKKQAQIALLTKDKQLQAEENRRERLLLYALLGGLGLVLLMAVVLYRNNRQKQHANMLLQKQKEEIDNKARELSVQKDNLEQSYNNIELLGEIGRKITASLSVEKISSTVYDNVNAMMGAAVFGIGIYNEDLNRIEFHATYENGQPLPFYTNSIYDENRFDVLCFRNRQEIIIGDLGKEYQTYIQQVQTPKAGDSTESLIYLPLTAKEKVLGVITVQSFEKNAYSDYHLFMLRNIAIYTAIALENAYAFNKLHLTLASLRKTQAQLVQSEKMASLGELTAGIAHEIQNPLNFVNNFSEVNKELLAELKEEIGKGNYEGVKAIAKDVMENQEKINHHGRRADAIVKGMLQHSRQTDGAVKELTDLNKLADEYLRLAYHGLRAKEKDFNAALKTDFDPDLSSAGAGINIVPQDIGRVLLNLYNNSFYAVAKKKKQSAVNYEPLVAVRTKRTGDKVEIHVSDNGGGIPQNIVDKIFQPFFTTKPTGQGTGLGLSLSYDIVKAHGGELEVETKEGEGSEFVVSLPC